MIRMIAGIEKILLIR